MLIIPREICCNLNQALAREWLVTNGLGSFASSSITGANTRRYHGLLVTARSPLSRMVTLAKIDEEVETGGATYRLGTNEYENDAIYPEGYVFLDHVELDGMLPTFVYRTAKFALRKTIWMEYRRNTTYIRYTVESTSDPIRLTLLPLCTYRDAHVHARGWLDWHLTVRALNDVVSITATPEAIPYHLIAIPSANFAPMDLWYWRFRHRAEQERGLDSIEDLYFPGQWQANLQPGQSLAIAVTTEDPATVDRDGDAALQREQARQAALAQNARDDFEKQLFIAADQFVIQRSIGEAKADTIVAGYPWLTDRGRDALIAMEGLTLTTKRFTEARNILLAYLHYVDQGMLPNRLPDPGSDSAPIEYSALDTALWYFHALDRYVTVTRDDTLLDELFPALQSIIDWHVEGMRYGIHVDPADGLLGGGIPDVQLTWMDMKAGDWVITPRIGKPVEINALWYRALCLMEQWAARFGQSPTRYRDLATEVRTSFDRFWYAKGGYLYDVIDTPYGDDASLRPNQLFALSLADDLISPERAKSILNVVAQNLLTPYGLRSLSSYDPHYHGLYRGDQFARDGAYYQGAVWAWLIGSYLDAYLKIYGQDDSVRAAIEVFRTHLSEAAIGTIGEIFEGNPPYNPGGCVAQAWSVAEVLRIKSMLRE